MIATEFKINVDSLFTAPVSVMVQAAFALSFAYYFYLDHELDLVAFYLGTGSSLLLSLIFWNSKFKKIAQVLVVGTLFPGFLYSLTHSFSALSLAWCLSSLRTIMEVCPRPANLPVGATLLCFASIILFSPTTILSPYSTTESLQFILLCFVTMIFVYEASSSRGKYAHNIDHLSLQIDQFKLIDALTGLYNRQHAERYLKEKYSKPQGEESSFGVILADLDNFKSINERYGLAVGDNVLTIVGQLLSDSLSEEYKLARWAGNTFIVIVPHNEPSASNIIADVLLQKINSLKINAKGAKLTVSISIGISTQSKCSDLNDLISCAENSLYQAKNMGGNLAITS